MFETTAGSTPLPHQLVRLKRETNETTSLFYSLPSSTLLVKFGAGWSLLRRWRMYLSPSPSPPMLSAELHVSHPYQSLGSIKARTSEFDSKLSSLEGIWDFKREETVSTKRSSVRIATTVNQFGKQKRPTQWRPMQLQVIRLQNTVAAWFLFCCLLLSGLCAVRSAVMMVGGCPGEGGRWTLSLLLFGLMILYQKHSTAFIRSLTSNCYLGPRPRRVSQARFPSGAHSRDKAYPWQRGSLPVRGITTSISLA